MQVGLWIQTKQEETYLVKKDANGYPDLSAFSPSPKLEDFNAKKEKGKALYEELTGTKYPHPHATTRQVLWDFLEAAIKQLP
ncbi:MAG: hypothetical protein ABGX83_01445 [Nitrospira sp.]|nr:hypothetical protein [Candidatus Manganitrophaceae bacterium]HIL35193.1 hypothetical protein [Candidatus Manganitrophaceae bacterium]